MCHWEVGEVAILIGRIDNFGNTNGGIKHGLKARHDTLGPMERLNEIQKIRKG